MLFWTQDSFDWNLHNNCHLHLLSRYYRVFLGMLYKTEEKKTKSKFHMYFDEAWYPLDPGLHSCYDKTQLITVLHGQTRTGEKYGRLNLENI